VEPIAAQFKPMFEALGVEPWMYPVLISFGVGHQFAKGLIKRWTDPWSVVSAASFSTAFGAASWVEHALTPTAGMTRIVVLFAATMAAEGIVGMLAGKVPFIPKNNQWTEPPK